MLIVLSAEENKERVDEVNINITGEGIQVWTSKILTDDELYDPGFCRFHLAWPS